MTKVSLRGLAQRKMRAFVTMLAVLLGVAFIAGSYVLTDTINDRSTTSSIRPTRARTWPSSSSATGESDAASRLPSPPAI